MVRGLDTFVEKFRDYGDCYTIIGGTACDILMKEQELGFRATKDIDMIVIMEARTEDFARLFWEYIMEGGYKCGWKNSEVSHYYRFTEPNPGYPVQIELFARQQGYHLNADRTIIPIHITEDISSLSAILLDDTYYKFMLSGHRQVQGVSVLSAEYIIPFKMFAWLDLNEKKAQGNHVNDKDLRKHKLDVFRLLDIIDVDTKVVLPEKIKISVKQFMAYVEDEDLQQILEQIGMRLRFDDAIQMLKDVYIL